MAYVTLQDVELIAQTERAVLIEFDDESTDGPIEGVNRFWVPKSVIEDLSEFCEDGDISAIEVKDWWVAQCNGLEECLEL